LKITTAAALAAKNGGTSHRRGQAQPTVRPDQYAEQLYTDRFEEWIAEDASRLDTVARHAMAALEYNPAHLPVSATFLEAWTRLRDAASEDERQVIEQGVKDIEFDDSAKFQPLAKCMVLIGLCPSASHCGFHDGRLCRAQRVPGDRPHGRTSKIVASPATRVRLWLM
jgi:hypothetical protein